MEEAQMMKAHGRASIQRERQTLFITISGSWNLEGFLKFEKQFKAAAREIDSKAWGVIVDIREWGLTTPDAKAAELELQLWTIEHNQRWRAFVSDENPIKEIQIDRSAEPVSHAIESRYFQTIEDAREWFTELGLL